MESAFSQLRLLLFLNCIRAFPIEQVVNYKHPAGLKEKERTSQCPPRGNAPAVAEATLASAAAVALTTVEETPLLLDFGAKTEAAFAFPAVRDREMRDGIARARGARGERLDGAIRVEDAADEDDDDEDEARPPQEAAAAARAAIVFFFLACC